MPDVVIIPKRALVVNTLFYTVRRLPIPTRRVGIAEVARPAQPGALDHGRGIAVAALPFPVCIPRPELRFGCRWRFRKRRPNPLGVWGHPRQLLQIRAFLASGHRATQFMPLQLQDAGQFTTRPFFT